MKPTMPFVDRADIEKVKLSGIDAVLWDEGCVVASPGPSIIMYRRGARLAWRA